MKSEVVFIFQLLVGDNVFFVRKRNYRGVLKRITIKDIVNLCKFLFILKYSKRLTLN